MIENGQCESSASHTRLCDAVQACAKLFHDVFMTIDGYAMLFKAVHSMQIVTLHTMGGKNWKEFQQIPIVVERIPITNCCRRSTRMRSTLQIFQITTASSQA